MVFLCIVLDINFRGQASSNRSHMSHVDVGESNTGQNVTRIDACWVMTTFCMLHSVSFSRRKTHCSSLSLTR